MLFTIKYEKLCQRWMSTMTLEINCSFPPDFKRFCNKLCYVALSAFAFYSVMGLLVWPCERILEGEGQKEHSLPLLWGHEGSKGNSQKLISTNHAVEAHLSLHLFCKNPRREVERIMRYLDVSVSDEVISKIVELTSFEKMKDNPMANYSCIPAPVFDHSISSFMRKGMVVMS